MFSFAKKPAQEVVLQDLTEDQLTQVAGGSKSSDSSKSSESSPSSDSSKSSKSTHHHHHHHHHHHVWKNDHDGDDK